MWLSFYNPKGVGDVLMLVAGDLPREQVATETQANITRIFDKETNETYGYNIFDLSSYFELEDTGHVKLNETQLDLLNQHLYESGFEAVELETEPRLVVAKVLECEPHHDSDHLSVTQTDIGGETVQIVCGASNVHEGMTTIAALPDAVMPNGQIIRPGQLRGVDSLGMLCSAYELGADPEHKQEGIIELDEGLTAGTPAAEVLSD